MKTLITPICLLAAVLTSSGCRTTLTRDELIYECSPAGLMENGWYNVVLHYEGSSDDYHLFVMVQYFPSWRTIRVPTKSLTIPPELRFAYSPDKFVTVQNIGGQPVGMSKVDYYDAKQIEKYRREGFTFLEAPASDGSITYWQVHRFDSNVMDIP
ncbi:MAG: hypothetical protein WD768_20045 [Phycisphaeraceae bacterium]